MIDGKAAMAGVDPVMLPLDRFCNLVYFAFTEHMDEKEKRSFDAMLDRPMAGIVPTEGVWSDEEMASSFRAFEAEMSS